MEVQNSLNNYSPGCDREGGLQILLPEARELWSGGALELKCPELEVALKHVVWNTPQILQGTEKKLMWEVSYAPFMNPSCTDSQ